MMQSIVLKHFILKIENIKINSFGTLKNKEINLDKNVNIIYGKNERVVRDMNKDVSWQQSAKQYKDMYVELTPKY